MLKFRPLLWPTLTTLPLLCLGLVLGFWQMARLDWKNALTDRVEQRALAETQWIDDVISRSAAFDDLDYWQIKVVGTFDHDREIHLFATDAQGQIGYRIVTPLHRPGRTTVFVDRGFVPAGLKNRNLRKDGLVEGDVVVTGITRLSWRQGAFQPDNQLADNLWFYLDLDEMAKAAGITNYLPLYVQADTTPNTGGWPKGSPPLVQVTNNHLAYVITWFSLSAVLVIIYFLYHYQSGRLVLPIVPRNVRR